MLFLPEKYNIRKGADCKVNVENVVYTCNRVNISVMNEKVEKNSR